MRKLGPALVLLLLGAVLAGCTPADEPLVGLTVIDGKPVAVLVSCGDFSIASVYQDEPGAASRVPSSLSALQEWSVSSSSTAAGQVTEIVLFARPPAGWRVDSSDITGLQPGVRYSLGGMSFRHARPVRFYSADLQALDSGRVLTAVGINRNKLVSRSAFEKTAQGRCP